MVPKIELEADYLREKARKDLLGLLEGVSRAAVDNVSLFTCHFSLVAKAYHYGRFEARRI